MRMRQHSSIVIAATLLFLFGLAPSTHAGRAQAPDLKILLVGNSLVRGVKRPLITIFKAQNVVVRIKAAAPGIRDLQWHAESPNTKKIIASEAWDFVFLQQKSLGLAAADGGYQAVADLLNIIIHDRPQGSPIPETTLFMTWKDRDTAWNSLAWDNLKGNPGDDYGYVPIALDLGIGVAPVGWSVREARRQLGEPPSVDLWKGGKGHHLSTPGQYLAACVVYAVVTGQSPIGIWWPDRFGQQMSEFLQQVADQVVFTDPSAWNLPSGTN
jgi:hypothetical protein